MILKKLTQLIFKYKFEFDVKLESVVKENELISNFKREKEPKILIKFVLPIELNRDQLSDIKENL